MHYGIFNRGSMADPIYHIESGYRLALCSGSRMATIVADTGATPSEFHGRLCKKCTSIWDEQTRD